MRQQNLLIATHNPGKMREYGRLLEGIPFRLVSLGDLGITYEVDETGDTFEENAWLKAGGYSAKSGLLTLADDSGLAVDALNGEPGVLSARYGAPQAVTDGDRVELLLRNLENVTWARRTARFRCVLAIASPAGLSGAGEEISPDPPLRKWGTTTGVEQDRSLDEVRLMACVVGSVAGMIQYNPQGDDGFGYDPVFYLPSYDKTMAEIPLDEKNRISHRADAARKAVSFLQKLATAGA